MKVRMEVVFDAEEVREVMKQEYIRRFGKPVDGFYLAATSTGCYSVQPVKVETIEGDDPDFTLVIPPVPPTVPQQVLKQGENELW